MRSAGLSRGTHPVSLVDQSICIFKRQLLNIHRGSPVLDAVFPLVCEV